MTKKLLISLLIFDCLIFEINIINFRSQIVVTTNSNEQKIRTLVDQMTLAEKLGQMTLVEKNSIKKGDITRKNIGAILSGGGSNPSINTPDEWYSMINKFQQEAVNTRLGIPLLYGIDAVHGDGNVMGAVIFPQNIGLGATRDQSLVREIARITAVEMSATGQNWNFSPTLSVPKDLRWGRVYECFSTNPLLVSAMGKSYTEGLMDGKVLPTLKHFIGEGQAAWGSSKQYKIDQGDVMMSKNDLKNIYLIPYSDAIKTGAMSIMISRSSWLGQKISSNKYLLTEILKKQLNFKGFLVSDWGAIDQISKDDYQNVVESINAGMDMIMVPSDYDKFMNNLNYAVVNNDISMGRIDDAVSRILRAKLSLGLFAQPMQKFDLNNVGSVDHRLLARKAVAESLVLLKNNNALPINKKIENILIVGKGANDVGIQSGGWTINWQGVTGYNFLGTSIYDAFKKKFKDKNIILKLSGDKSLASKGDIGIVVVAETPYAEGVGDSADLSLSKIDQENIRFTKQNSKKTILLIIAGRPLIITDFINGVDAAVMLWLPGSEGDGIVDVLSGDNEFHGKLPLDWPKTMKQVQENDLSKPLFQFDYGLKYKM